MKIGVIYIHGVHGYIRGYADMLHESAVDTADLELRGREDLEVVSRTVYWADIFEAQRQSLVRSARHLGWRKLREFVASSIAHAVGYEDAPGYGAYEAVHARIDSALASLAEEIGPDSPVIMVSHSLGTVIASNFIWDHQHDTTPRATPMEALKTLKGLITMGCPLALYSSRWPNGGEAIQATSAGVRWWNLIAKNDVLAWPLTCINASYSREVEQDLPVSVQGILRWTPAAHGSYWDSTDVADKLGEMIAQVYHDSKRKA